MIRYSYPNYSILTWWWSIQLHSTSYRCCYSKCKYITNRVIWQLYIFVLITMFVINSITSSDLLLFSQYCNSLKSNLQVSQRLAKLYELIGQHWKLFPPVTMGVWTKTSFTVSQVFRVVILCQVQFSPLAAASKAWQFSLVCRVVNPHGTHHILKWHVCADI